MAPQMHNEDPTTAKKQSVNPYKAGTEGKFNIVPTRFRAVKNFRADLDQADQEQSVRKTVAVRETQSLERNHLATLASRQDHRCMLRGLVTEAYNFHASLKKADKAPTPDPKYVIRREFINQLLVGIDRTVEVSIKRDCDLYLATIAKICDMQLFDTRSTAA